MDLKNSLLTQTCKMRQNLFELCQINSGSTNLAGLNKLAQLVKSKFNPLADKITFLKLPSQSIISLNGAASTQHYADGIFIQKRPHLQNRVLLSGHMDTVFSATSKFQNLTQLSPNILQGPGVIDMKGGIIIMRYALEAFESISNHALGWDVLLTSDEELGSPASKYLFKEIVKNYKAALIYEPAMTASGVLAKNRKGSCKYTLVARGKAAHVGRDFELGRNAICYLAEILLKINKLNTANLHINIGLIQGGTALNAIPDIAVAKIDVRYQTDIKFFEQQLQAIENASRKAGYVLEISGGVSRPAKNVSLAEKELFAKLTAIANKFAIKLAWQDSGGCCDGNNFSELGLANLDTLGACGGNLHNDKEFIMLDSMPQRALLSALLLKELE